MNNQETSAPLAERTAGFVADDGSVVDVSRSGRVAVVRFSRPPNNYFSTQLVTVLADALEQVDAEPGVHAVVLASDGRNFCAGAELTRAREEPESLYAAAHRLFEIRKPIVAAVQGSAVGGGLGLSLVADFRIAAPSTRMSVNFVKIGIHPGFGITLLLPSIVGRQKAAELLYTGRRITGEEAFAIGLADRLVPEERLFATAMDLAQEIAENAPLAVEATRATLREGLLDAIRERTAREARKQIELSVTEDFAEGIRAVEERRPGNWQRR